MANQYKTHFYCALCGGPFAQIFRTAAEPESKHAVHSFDSDDVGIAPKHLNPDIDLDNEFSIPLDENREIPEEYVLSNMGYAASRHRDHRIRASIDGLRRGIMSDIRRTWRAYDGRRISTEQIKWTQNLRALIHKKAKSLPYGGDYYLFDASQFLTGKGRIRQIDAWADAYANYEEEDDLLELTRWSDDRYGFQVYQEYNRHDSDFVISSIPFHEQCWDLLVHATEVSAQERGVDVHKDPIDENDDILWNHLRGLVGISGVAGWIGFGVRATLHGDLRGEVVTRLGEVDYREAQGSGEGFQWRHDEGLHVGSEQYFRF